MPRRAGRAQPGGQFGIDPDRASELAQQQFLGTIQPAAQATVVVPGLLGGTPAGWDRRPIAAGTPAARPVSPPSTVGEPEGRPCRPGLLDADLVPRRQRVGQRVEFVRVRVDPAVRRGQRGQPSFLGWEAFRTAAPPRRKQIVGRRHRRTCRRIHEGLQRRQHQFVGALARPDSARQTGGIAPTSAFSVMTSAPWTTGRQNATGPCTSQPSAGSMRPRPTNSRAKAATSAK